MDGFGTTTISSVSDDPQSGAHSRSRLRGFATAQLIAGLAIIAAIALLMQLQSGAIDPPGFMQPKPAKARKDSAQTPQFFATEAVDPAAPAAPTDLATAIAREENLKNSLRESWQALGHMDPAAAAALLAETEPDKALLMLSCLRERELSPILEQAPPAQSAKWLSQLAALPIRSEAALEEAAASGTALPLDPLAESLQHFRIGLGLEKAPVEEAPADAGDAAAELSAAAGEQSPLEPAEAEADAGALPEGEALPGTDQASATLPPAEESIT